MSIPSHAGAHSLHKPSDTRGPPDDALTPLAARALATKPWDGWPPKPAAASVVNPASPGAAQNAAGRTDADATEQKQKPRQLAETTHNKMHGSGPPLDPYPRDDEVREAPLSDKPPSPARSKASRSNSPGSFELDDFLEKDEAYRAIMSETMGDGLAQNFLFDDSPPRQQPASPPRQQQPSPQQRTFNGKQPPSQKPPPRDFVDDARPPRTACSP